MKKSLTFLTLALVASLHPALAGEQFAVRRAVEAGQLKSLSEILALVQAHHPGKVLDVDLERDRSGQRVYEITLLSDNGQRSKVLVDAVSGVEVRPQTAGLVTPKQPVPRTLRGLLARHPGQVLELELKRGPGGRLVYEIQLIENDGRLREFVVDAASGQLLNSEGHRLGVLRKLKPLPDILDQLPARYRGVIQEIELEYDQEGRYFYEIEIRLGDDRVLELDIDAVTGEILNGDEVGR